MGLGIHTNIQVKLKQIEGWHTQFEGFCLTLEYIALTWFLNIKSTTYLELETMEKDFIEAFLKMGTAQWH